MIKGTTEQDPVFQQLRAEFLGRLAEREERMLLAFTEAKNPALSKQERRVHLDALYMEAHKLAAAAGGYQFYELSDVAGLLEESLWVDLNKEGLDADVVCRDLEEVLVKLLKLLQQARS